MNASPYALPTELHGQDVLGSQFMLYICILIYRKRAFLHINPATNYTQFD